MAISDATTMLKLGHNVTLLLSIEGIQIGVKNPHHYLGLDMLTRNVTNFISDGGKVIICEVCLRIAGYNNSDIIDKAIVGKPDILSNLLSNCYNNRLLVSIFFQIRLRLLSVSIALSYFISSCDNHICTMFRKEICHCSSISLS